MARRWRAWLLALPLTLALAACVGEEVAGPAAALPEEAPSAPAPDLAPLVAASEAAGDRHLMEEHGLGQAFTPTATGRESGFTAEELFHVHFATGVIPSVADPLVNLQLQVTGNFPTLQPCAGVGLVTTTQLLYRIRLTRVSGTFVLPAEAAAINHEQSSLFAPFPPRPPGVDHVEAVAAPINPICPPHIILAGRLTWRQPNRPPLANAGPDRTVFRTQASGALVQLQGSGSDPDGDPIHAAWRRPPFNPTPFASGFTPTVTLPLGINDLGLRVTDQELVSSDVVRWTVLNSPPVANAGPDQTRTRTSHAGAVFQLDGRQSSDQDGVILGNVWSEGVKQLVSGRTASVTLQPIGPHTITLRVVDNNGALGSDEVVLTVLNAPPAASAGPDQIVECASPAGTDITADGSGSTDVDGDIVAYDWLSGGGLIASGVDPTVGLSLGSHLLTLRVRDDDGAEDSDEVLHHVVDTNAPALEMRVSQTRLSPPNGRMVRVAGGIAAEDSCDPAPHLLVEVASDEAVDGPGSGQTAPDWEVRDNGDGTFDVWMRAERAGDGDGRVYTITALAADASGNETRQTATVDVPHDSGQRPDGR